ncbi:MAG: hypothetical protein ACOX1P_00180 [Thermoguttaceae bacterium]
MAADAVDRRRHRGPVHLLPGSAATGHYRRPRLRPTEPLDRANLLARRLAGSTASPGASTPIRRTRSRRGEPRTKPYFDFDKNRLVGYQFFPAKIQPASPYVYFRAVKIGAKYEYGAVNGTTFIPYQVGSGDNICVPYLEDAVNENPVGAGDARAWRAPETYQILSAGLDGVYSTNDNTTPATPAPFRVSRLGVGFSNGDYDNLASFAEGELEAEL